MGRSLQLFLKSLRQSLDLSYTSFHARGSAQGETTNIQTDSPVSLWGSSQLWNIIKVPGHSRLDSLEAKGNHLANISTKMLLIRKPTAKPLSWAKGMFSQMIIC